MVANSRDFIVVGAGLAGMAAAIAAAEAGMKVLLLEKGPLIGGACAFSGGQVWVGGNHVAARLGIEDSADTTMEYVMADAAAKSAPESLNHDLAARWIHGAIAATRYFEELEVINWRVIPDFPDYYYPQMRGSRPAGRYLTAQFNGNRLGAARKLLQVSPHFPVGVTYEEIAAWGGLPSRTTWDWQLVQRRREEDFLTFGTAIAASFFKGVIDRGVRVLTEHAAEELVVSGQRVTGLRARTSGRTVEFRGQVLLATGAHDWSNEYVARFIGISAGEGGSVAPPTITGDAMRLVQSVDGAIASLPNWAAPSLAGYRIDDSIYPGDQGYRSCSESSLPHSFIVNSSGVRFCDDSFHVAVADAALRVDKSGRRVNMPMFMVWDESHHEKYGLGRVMPGGDYPPDLVASAGSLRELGAKLGIDGAQLERTAGEFSQHAARGEDPKFGRGTVLSVRMFRGDRRHKPNPNLGPVDRPPFYGMKLRLLNTGIAAGGVRTDMNGRVLRTNGDCVEGLYSAGEAVVRETVGVAYNSGFSLSRAMTFGWLAARHAAGNPVDLPAP